MYYNQQTDIDIGSCINHMNWDSENPSLTESQIDYRGTQSQHINLPLNTNGKLTGWDCRGNTLDININTNVATF